MIYLSQTKVSVVYMSIKVLKELVSYMTLQPVPSCELPQGTCCSWTSPLVCTDLYSLNKYPPQLDYELEIFMM